MAHDIKIVIVGIGNEFRSDDGAGSAVAKHLAGMKLPNVRVVDQVGDGTDLINAWRDTDAAFVIDCMRSGNRPGTIRRFDVRREKIPEEILPGLSTHAFNIGATVRLSQSIGQLPRQLIVYGIEGSEYSVNDRLTRPVQAAVADVAGRIIAEIALLTRHATASEVRR